MKKEKEKKKKAERTRMQRLVQWLFPKQWLIVKEEKVCKHTYVRFEEIGDPSGKFEVKIVDDESDVISGSLGINEERHMFLYKKAKAAAIETGTITDALKIASKYCKHANELTMMTIIVWNMCKGGGGRMPDGLLGAIISSIPGPDKD